MYYVDDKPQPHYVSIATGKHYPFKLYDSDDKLRALKQLEADDTPSSEPRSKPELPEPTFQGAFHPAMQVRIQLDEMRLQQLRKK
jgi:hypothetical protein